MHPALRSLFEEQLAFSLENGEPIVGRVFIGDTEALPVKLLQADREAYRFEFSNWLNEIWRPRQALLRDELLDLSGNKHRYVELKQAVSRHRVVPFIGSGMSVPMGLPTWWDLLVAIAEQVLGESDTIQPLLKDGCFEAAVDAIISRTNNKLFNEKIEHQLKLDDSSDLLGAVRLLPMLFPELVVSSNMDAVLERLYQACEMPFESILTGAELSTFRKFSAKGDRILVKLHGDYRKPTTRVLSSIEYDSAYGGGGLARAELSNLYRNRALLFLGCSLVGDRTLSIIKEVADADPDCPKHFTMLPLPGSRNEQIRREEFLTSHGVFPIWYDGDHDECVLALLSGLLEELA
ncbi:MAG: hypothetical protein QOD09_1041 [Bradyrhizobium sp.]|nr:hypothetical protein [Bradyrhizobium sp.]MEA2952428.1 hypothetical protein [Alphaproteobacteria bacterium]